MARSGKSKDTPGGAKRWLVRALKFGLVATLGALFAIIVAVGE
jgi:penicillin-binding protein 1A